MVDTEEQEFGLTVELALKLNTLQSRIDEFFVSDFQRRIAHTIYISGLLVSFGEPPKDSSVELLKYLNHSLSECLIKYDPELYTRIMKFIAADVTDISEKLGK